MNIFRLFFSALTFFILSLSLTGQVNDRSIRQDVLKKGIVNKLFVFGKWKEKGETETHLKYLGKVTTKAGRTLKIMNYCFFWGLSKRATSRILIFNDRNQYVGNYGLTMTYDLPDKLEKGRLIFTNKGNEDCDKDLITSVNFKNGLPRQFFLKCKGEYGDIYSLDTGN
jgi:hypothetical protein